MMSRPCRQCPNPKGGFTLVELIATLALSAVLITAAVEVLITQNRSFQLQQELADVDQTLRGAAALISWELRQASASEGDIYAIASDAITLRSVQSTGVVCAKHASALRVALWAVGGEFTRSSGDSVLIFASGANGVGDDTWKTLQVDTVDSGTALGMPTCDWPAAPTPEAAIGLTGVTFLDWAGIRVGAPIRSFRKVEYAVYLDGGRWWLGRKVGAAASYEMLTGPLISQASGGLELRYFDAAGNTVTDPALVAVVEVIIRAESTHEVMNPDGSTTPQDTIVTKIALRG